MKIFGKILCNFKDISTNLRFNFWKCFKKYLENREKIAKNFFKILKFLKILNFGDFLINFQITYGKYCINFKENSCDVWNQLVEVFEVFRWNFGRTARNFWRNLREIGKKILNNFRKIMKTLFEKFEVIPNWCYSYHKEILECFSEITSMKLR